jgi:23S rRNA pseudouridine2605 synthase
MLVDGVERLFQLPFAIGLMQAADCQFVRIVRRVAGDEQQRHAALPGFGGELDARPFAAQPHVAEDQIDLFAVERGDRFLEIVMGGDDVITGVAKHDFIVEGGQRFVLDDEDTLDDTLALAEQHGFPSRTNLVPPQRTKRPVVPRGRKGPPPPREDGPQRIAKLLARAGVASRRDVERMIAEGRIALDGEVLTTPATLLDNLNNVTVDGKPVKKPEAARLFRYYKPPATLTAARDPKGRATIYDRLPPGLPRLIPVGRLDFMTEGLLLLTNDGELKRQLELPKTGVVRRYRARAFGAISQDQLEDLAEGVTIDGVHYGSIDANLERRTGRNCWIEMALTEGKNREVRIVLAHLGLQVSRLIRTSYGPITLEGLEPGQIAEVQREDLFRFRQSLK